MYYKNDKVDGWKIQIKDRLLRYKHADLIDSLNFTFIPMFPLNYITNTIRLDSENKNNQISTCSSCNIQNEYIDYDPNYICLKCKNNW